MPTRGKGLTMRLGSKRSKWRLSCCAWVFYSSPADVFLFRTRSVVESKGGTDRGSHRRCCLGHHNKEKDFTSFSNYSRPHIQGGANRTRHPNYPYIKLERYIVIPWLPPPPPPPSVRDTSASWWSHPASENWLSPRCLSHNLLSSITYLLAWEVALVSDWTIKTQKLVERSMAWRKIR